MIEEYENLNLARLTTLQKKRALEHFSNIENLEEALKLDPYLLIQVDGFAWKTVDKIATQRLDVEENDPRRLSALVVFCFDESSNGHCYFSKNQALDLVNNKIGVGGRQRSLEALALANQRGLIKLEENYVWLTKTLESEIFVADYILNAVKKNSSNNNHVEDAMLNQKLAATSLTDEQKKAIELILKSNISAITGGAGSGKTFLLKELTEITDCILISFTGKAALRMREITGKDASTIHSFLINAVANPSLFSKKLIVVDEASMLSLALCSRLLNAAGYLHNKIVFIGDANQLPSIEPGQVFHDILHEMSAVDSIKLTRGIRTEGSQSLALASEAVLSGEFPKNGKDFGIYLSEDQPYSTDPIDNFVIQRCLVAVRKAIDLKMDDWIDAPVLSWERKYVNLLNNEIQNIKNPFHSGVGQWRTSFSEASTNKCYRVGDPVVHLANDKERGLANGDVGIIIDIVDVPAGKGGGTKIYVEYSNGRTSSYSTVTGEASLIDLAYALTVHKSQGSEYKSVMVCLPTSHRYSERALLYTAITRGKEKVAVFSTESTLRKFLKNDFRGKRNTKLSSRISVPLINMPLNGEE